MQQNLNQYESLVSIEKAIVDLLVNKDRKQQERFNLLFKELARVTKPATYTAVSRIWINSLLKDYNITLTTTLKNKVKRLLDNSHLKKRVEYNAITYISKQPAYSCIDDKTIIKNHSLIDENNTAMALSYRVVGSVNRNRKVVFYYFS